MSRTQLFPIPDSTEPRDEDLEIAGRDDKGQWAPAPWWVGIVLTLGIPAVSIIGGALLGLTTATGWIVFRVLTRSVR